VPSTFARLVPERLETVAVELGPETVVFTYDANGMTLSWGERWDKASTARENALVLLDVVKAWDVVSDDGTPDPISIERLSELPIWMLNEINRAIMQASRPSSEEGNESSASSAASGQAVGHSEPASQTSPNGSASTESQTVSVSPPTT
jgi:hypothetical protein